MSIEEEDLHTGEFGEHFIEVDLDGLAGVHEGVCGGWGRRYMGREAIGRMLVVRKTWADRWGWGVAIGISRWQTASQLGDVYVLDGCVAHALAVGASGGADESVIDDDDESKASEGRSSRLSQVE